MQKSVHFQQCVIVAMKLENALLYPPAKMEFVVALVQHQPGNAKLAVNAFDPSAIAKVKSAAKRCCCTEGVCTSAIGVCGGTPRDTQLLDYIPFKFDDGGRLLISWNASQQFHPR
jgi:hypothetical protein